MSVGALVRVGLNKKRRSCSATARTPASSTVTFRHLYIPAEKSGDSCRAEGETAEDLARLKANFPTPRDAATHIMDTFPIVRRNDEEKFNGDYRTKCVILEIYDALAESIRIDQPYKTRLDPPPADPRVADALAAGGR